MKYLIVENERLSREELRRNIKSLRPDWTEVGIAETIGEACDNLPASGDIDLIFMDIELDDGQCFEIFDKVETNASIIFTTAYSDYALQAFHLNSLDYLLKPYSKEALEKALQKFERFFREHDSEEPSRSLNHQQCVSDPVVSKQSQMAIPRILLTIGDSYRHIPLEEVRWFESEDKCVICINQTGKSGLTGFKSLKELEDRLPYDNFFRLRRNVLASIKAVSEVNRFFKGALKVTLTAGEKETIVIVPQNKRQDFLDWFGMH